MEAQSSSMFDKDPLLLFADRFSENELKDLCFEIGVDYENFPDKGKNYRARAFILEIKLQDRLMELAILCRNLRPDIEDWYSILEKIELDQVIPQLPPTSIVGRLIEIEKIEKVLRTNQEQGILSIVVITGMSGVGKTELVRTLGYRLRKQFPDGQFLVNLHGLREPKATEQALIEIINAFSSADVQELTANSDQFQQQYQKLLMGKRALIIADDAHNPVQIRPLLPPIGSALLITTRQRFSWEGTIIELKKFSQNDAVVLLQYHYSEITMPTARRLAEICDGLPLALKISAANLAQGTLPEDRYMTRLSQEKLRLDRLRLQGDSDADVPASIHLSYKLLGEQTIAQQILRRFSVFIANFDLDAAEAIALTEQIDSLVFEDAIETLYKYNLIDFDRVTRRYELHDLIRLFSEKQLLPDEQLDIQQRFVAYYLKITEVAQQKLDGMHQNDALKRLDLERNHIEKALDLSLTNHIVDNSLRLGATLWKYWERRGWFKQGRNELAKIIALVGDVPITETEQVRLLAEVLSGMGMLAHYQGDYGAAIAHHTDSLMYRNRLVEKDLIARTLSNLGLALSIRGWPGDIEEAEIKLKESLNLFEQSGFPLGIATVTGNLGLVVRAQARFDDAEIYFRRSIHMYEAIKDDAGIALYTTNLASIYLYGGHPLKALETYDIAHELFEKLDDPWGIMVAYEGKGWAYLDLAELQQAKRCFKNGLQAAQDENINDFDVSVLCLDGLADVCMFTAEWEPAVNYLGVADGIRAAKGIVISEIDQPREKRRVARLQNHPDAKRLYQMREMAKASYEAKLIELLRDL